RPPAPAGDRRRSRYALTVAPRCLRESDTTRGATRKAPRFAPQTQLYFFQFYTQVEYAQALTYVMAELQKRSWGSFPARTNTIRSRIAVPGRPIRRGCASARGREAGNRPDSHGIADRTC